MKRHPRWVAALASVALVTAACGSGDEAIDDNAGAGDATTAASDSGSGSDAADGDFTGTVTIGAALSETGKYSQEGEDSRQGYDTWAKWVNEEYGGIKMPDGNYNVEIVYYDDESDPDTAQNLTQRLIDEDQVDFLLGPYSSGLTKPASAIAEAENVIMVEANGTANEIFEQGYQNLFLVATLGSDYTKTGIEAAAAAGAETAVVAYEDASFPTAVGKGAIEHLEANGIEVLAEETYPAGIQDVSAIMTKFRDLDPDLFVGGGHYVDAVLFSNAAEELGFAPQAMLITVGPSNPDLVEELGEDIYGVIGPTQWEGSMAWEGEWLGSAGEYAAYYESLWGETPTYQAAGATASGLALHLAVEAAGSTETDAVREAMLELDVDTFYGPIKFDPSDNTNKAKPMGTVQIQDGEINVVAPEGAATTEFQFPMP